MNIWIFNQYINLPEFPGGTRHIDIAKELTKQGHNVHLFASGFNYVLHKEIILKDGQKSINQKIDNIEIHWLRILQYKKNNIKRFFSMFSFFRALRQEVRKMKKKNDFVKPDIIIGSSVHLVTVLAAQKIAKNLNSRFVMEVRDLWPFAIIALKNMSKYHPLILMFTWLEKYLYKKAEKIIVVAEKAGEYIRQYTDESKVVWIPNSFSSDRLKDLKSVITKNDKFTIMYAGAIGIPNDMITVVKAFQLLKKHKDIQLIIVGDGVEKENIRKYVKENNLSKVKLLDAIPKSKVLNFLQEADVLWVGMIDSKLYEYGYSWNKFYDYMAVSKPIILSATNKSNFVNESNCGSVVKSENPELLSEKILELKNMPENERLQLGENGFNYLMNNFTTKLITDKLLKEVLIPVKGK